MLNNREKSPQREGAYVGFSGLTRGDVVTISVPLKNRTTKETVEGVEYTLEWNGKHDCAHVTQGDGGRFINGRII